MRERERESSIADMNDLLVTNEQVALRRENANVFLLKFAHTRVSLLSSISISIDINMTTTTTRRKQNDPPLLLFILLLHHHRHLLHLLLPRVER